MPRPSSPRSSDAKIESILMAKETADLRVRSELKKSLRRCHEGRPKCGSGLRSHLQGGVVTYQKEGSKYLQGLIVGHKIKGNQG